MASGGVETLISERAIVGTYLQRSLSAPNSALPVPPENLTVNIIVRLAADGDEVAQSYSGKRRLLRHRPCQSG